VVFLNPISKMKAIALFFTVMCLAAFANAEAGVTLEDLPAFPRLAEVEDKTEVAATGPDNNILNGKPLKVPIIEDPFAQAPGSDAAKTLDRITQVLTMEPPSAAIPKAATDEVDILEVLDAAEGGKKKANSKKGKKGAKKGALKKNGEGKKKDAGKASGKKDSSLDNIAQVKKEISSLDKLISQAMKIQADLPKKKARLEELKKKLQEQATKAAATLAGKKSAAQASLLSSVESKMNILSQKLQKLTATKSLLHKSITGLQKIADGKAISQALIEQVENVDV